ncbi:MAG: EamA family transporter [Phycisphaerae bacterium]
MTSNLLIFGLLAEGALVTGQLLLKKAMHAHPRRPISRGKRVAFFATSIVAQALYFFLWLGLLHDYPLSSVYPFDAGALVLLVIAGIVLLHEKLTLRAALAMGFILSGLAIISMA